jgi:Glutathione S-transferase, N-terminal domain
MAGRSREDGALNRRKPSANHSKEIKMIKFYYHPSPNPAKVALFLEETGLPYEVIPIDTRKGEQFAKEFVAVNPNSKTPAIEDDGVPATGRLMLANWPPFSLFQVQTLGGV